MAEPRTEQTSQLDHESGTSANIAEEYDFDFLEVKDKLPLVWKGVILPSGIFLNALAIFVFIRSKSLRKMTSTLYLTALAAADTAVLFG